MSTSIADALLETLVSVEAYAGETFDLDTAMKLLEEATAILRDATPDERRFLLDRARALAEKRGGAKRDEFLRNVGDYLGLDEEA